MNCKNHPETAAEERCSGCAELFCGECLVEVLGQKYCGSCKVMTVKGPPPIEEGNEPCEAASKALTYSIVGIFCFGIVLGPMAIAKAIEAKKQIRDDPRLAGLVKANIGLLLGITVLALWVLGMIEKMKGR
ncbi:MAG: DUF4190 domain-containing protein [Verrucomicrobiota bacterium]